MSTATLDALHVVYMHGTDTDQREALMVLTALGYEVREIDAEHIELVDVASMERNDDGV